MRINRKVNSTFSTVNKRTVIRECTINDEVLGIGDGSRVRQITGNIELTGIRDSTGIVADNIFTRHFKRAEVLQDAIRVRTRQLTDLRINRKGNSTFSTVNKRTVIRECTVNNKVLGIVDGTRVRQGTCNIKRTGVRDRTSIVADNIFTRHFKRAKVVQLPTGLIFK